MAQLNLSLPALQGLDLSDERQMRKLTSYLYKLDEQLRYVLSNLGEENLSDSLRAVINASVDADAINELTGRLQRLGTQITQTAEAIKMTASKKELDALGEALSESVSEFEQTADEIRIAVRKKLDADAPSVGVQTASAVVNEKGVYLTGGEIDMRTSDGEDYVNITDSGVTASSMGAPDVTPRYAGPTKITVNPLATAEEMAAGGTFRSLKDALETISGRFVPYGVTVMLADGMTEYGDVFLKNAMFPAGLAITSSYYEHAKLMGQFSVSGCSGKLTVQFLDIQTHDEVNHNGYSLQGAGLYARLEYCTIRGTGNTDSHAVAASEGVNVYATYCEMYDCGYAIRANSMSRVWGYYNKGNCRYSSNAATLFASGSAPSDSTAFNYHTANGGQVFAASGVTVDQGSGGSTPSVPVIKTIELPAVVTASYNDNGVIDDMGDDIGQGWYKGTGHIKGCMWFDGDEIYRTLHNKTILSATLRLSMRKGVGRGEPVVVELSGTTSAVGSGAEVGASYGTICTAIPGEITTTAIKTDPVQDIVDGKISGLMLYSSDTGAYKERVYSKNYAKFDGAGDGDDKKPVLTVTYEG